MNIPFIVLSKNNKIIQKYVKKLYEESESYRIYTEKDAITVNSIGVQDVLHFGYDASSLYADGPIGVEAGMYTKDTVEFELLDVLDVINIEETVPSMIAERFIPKTYSFTYLLSEMDVEYSNLMKKARIQEVLFKKIGDNAEVPRLVDLRVDSGDGIKDSEAIISYSDAIKDLIHKTIDTEYIQLGDDNVFDIEIESMSVSSIVFEDGFIPVDNKEAVSNQYMGSHVYGVSIFATEPIYIDNDTFTDMYLSPINKTVMLLLEDLYISREKQLAHNILITDDREVIEPDHIISNREADTIIKQFFYGIKDNYIDNIAEFREYMKAICDIDIEYLKNGYTIAGGKIYLGFDYNNMYSIFNSDAIKNILFKKMGYYDKNIDGKTYHAARYFKDQKRISQLSAYAEQLGINIDISTQRLAETYYAIRKVVAKLCIMSPDVVSGQDVPDFPIVLPNTMQIIPPSMSYAVLPLILPRLVEPYYIDTSFHMPLIIVPPTTPSYVVQPQIPNLFHQPYIPNVKYMNIMYPVFSGVVNGVSIRNLSIPRPIDRAPVCKTKKSGDSPTMTVFDADGECRKRYIATSNRTINMIEAGAMLSKMDTENMYGMDSSSIPISVPEVAALMIYETLNCVSLSTGFPMNVDFCNIIVDVEEKQDIATTGFCSGGADGGTISEVTLEPGKYLIINGVIMDESGKITGSPIVTGSEIMDIVPVTLTPFVPLNSPENINNSNSAAAIMSESLNEYLQNVRYGEERNNNPIDVTIAGFEELKNGSSDRKFMLDYIKLDIRDDVPEVYGQGGNADSLGMLAGLSAEPRMISEVIEPRVAMTTDGIGVSGSPGNILRVYDDSVSDESFMNEVPYYVFNGDENLYVKNGLLVMYESSDSGSGAMSYVYDTSSGYTVDRGTKEIQNIVGDYIEEEGIYITSPSGSQKFIRINPSLGGLSSQEFPVPDCNAMPLTTMVTKQTPFVIIPVFVRMNGPRIVNECDTADGYYVSITKELSYDLSIDIVHENETTNEDDFDGGVPEKRTVIIPKGETKSESYSIKTKDDGVYEGNETYLQKIFEIYPSDGQAVSDEFIVQEPQVRTSIIDNPVGCRMDANVTTIVREGINVYVNVSGTINKSCDGSNKINYRITLIDIPDGEYPGAARGVDYDIIMKDIDGNVVANLDEGPYNGEFSEGFSSEAFTIETYVDENYEGPEVFRLRIENLSSCDSPSAFENGDGGGGSYYDFDVTIYDVDDPDYPGGDGGGGGGGGEEPGGGDGGGGGGGGGGVYELTCTLIIQPPVPPIAGSVGNDVAIGKITKSPAEETEMILLRTIEKEGRGEYGTDYYFTKTQNTDNWIEVFLEDGLGEFEMSLVNPADFWLIADTDCETNAPVPVVVSSVDDGGDGGGGDGGDGGGGGGGPIIPNPVSPGTPVLDIEAVVSVGSVKSGCDGTPSGSSGIDGGTYENISDLNSIDPDKGTQDPGEVPGAVTMNFNLIAAKPEVDAVVDGETIPGVTMKTVTVDICAVFGCVDGSRDGVGDVLAQGYPKDEIPSGSKVVYVGPAGEFMSKCIHERVGDSSWYTITFDTLLNAVEDKTTGLPFKGDFPIITSGDSGPLHKKLKHQTITIGDISTSGAMYHYKHAGTEPEWPVVSTYGGASATSLLAGSHLIMSGAGPLPIVIHTKKDNADEYKDNLPPNANIILFMNIASLTVVLKDIKAPLSQNRTVKFKWE
jgi:hypothetical protein